MTNPNDASSSASLLGKLSRGHPKTYSAEELEKRTKRLAEARLKRWAKNRNKKGRGK